MFGRRPLSQFIAVAEELNFRRAAARLHMTQPPLTQLVRKMEATLGVALLDRSGAGSRLTPAGAALLDGARRLLAQTDGLVEAVRQAGRGTGGVLRLGFVPSIGPVLLPDIVAAFRAALPRAHLELTAQTTAQQLEALRRGAIDLAIVVSAPSRADAQAFEVEPLHRATMCAALPAGHRMAARRRLRLAELADEPFVLLPSAQSPAYVGLIHAACARSGFAPRVVQEAAPVQAVLTMVACGVGVSVVPEALRGQVPPGVELVAFGDRPGLDYELSLVWLRGHQPPLLREFVDIARASARAAPDQPPPRSARAAASGVGATRRTSAKPASRAA